uniref:Uncharacterized protein n=1 Tax=Solanum lycopersicum TaxID=4081 RepID=A0A3Q7EYT2_SOLLC
MCSDADWAGDVNDRASTNGYILFIGQNPNDARTSTEAEYRAVAKALEETTIILVEMRLTFQKVLTIYCDNVGATYLCANSVLHSRMKHIAVDFHFARNQLASFPVFVVVSLLQLDVPPSLGDKHPSCPTSHGCCKYHLSKVRCLVSNMIVCALCFLNANVFK